MIFKINVVYFKKKKKNCHSIKMTDFQHLQGNYIDAVKINFFFRHSNVDGKYVAF